MAFNIVETSAVSVFDNFITFPERPLKETLEEKCHDFHIEKMLYPLGYSFGITFLEMMLNGRATALKILSNISPIKENSSVIAAIELKRLDYIRNSKSIMSHSSFNDLTTPSIQKKLIYAENLFKNLKSDMTEKEQNYMTDMAIEADKRMHQSVILIAPSTTITPPDLLFPPLI